MSEVQPDRFPGLDPSRYTFSLGVEAGGTTWASGQTASRREPNGGGVVSGGSVAEQASVCWAKTIAVLEAAGCGPGDVTELVEYVTADGLANAAARAAARETDRGASVMVVESLVRPDADLEVEVVAGGPAELVRLPQLLPIDHDGRVVAPGDFVAQCAWVLVKTVEYVTPAGLGRYREVADVRRQVLGRPFPASTGVVVAGLLGRTWQLEVEAVAALP